MRHIFLKHNYLKIGEKRDRALAKALLDGFLQLHESTSQYYVVTAHTSQDNGVNGLTNGNAESTSQVNEDLMEIVMDQSAHTNIKHTRK